MKSYLMVSVSLACTVACGQAALAQPPRELRPGTYALRLCRVTCDPRYPKNTFRSGWIVLGDAPVDLSNLPDSVRKWLELSYIMMATAGQRMAAFISRRIGPRSQRTPSSQDYFAGSATVHAIQSASSSISRLMPVTMCVSCRRRLGLLAPATRGARAPRRSTIRMIWSSGNISVRLTRRAARKPGTPSSRRCGQYLRNRYQNGERHSERP
jgi:hypothetical protein